MASASGGVAQADRSTACLRPSARLTVPVSSEDESSEPVRVVIYAKIYFWLLLENKDGIKT